MEIKRERLGNGTDGEFRARQLRARDMLRGDLEIRHVVGAQRFDTAGIVQKDEGCKVRQVDSVVEDQRRLHPTVGDERLSRELGQLSSIVHRGRSYAASLKMPPFAVAKYSSPAASSPKEVNVDTVKGSRRTSVARPACKRKLQRIPEQ